MIYDIVYSQAYDKLASFYDACAQAKRAARAFSQESRQALVLRRKVSSTGIYAI